MKSFTFAIVAILAALCFVQSASAQNRPLKAGDPVLVELKVPAEDATNVSSSYTISERGTVRMPYLNSEIAAAGLTTTDLARRIEAAYRNAEIYTNPTINILINDPSKAAPHIVTVGGEVKSGGREVPLRDNMSLYQAIMAAGGFTEFADVRRVRLMRGKRSEIFDMRKIQDNGSNNPILMDGDTIHVPQD